MKKRLFIPPLLKTVALIGFSLVLGITKTSAQQLIPIESRHNALVLRVDADSKLGMVYFGRKLSDPGEYSEILPNYNLATDYSEVLNAAYTSAGSQNLMEPAITVQHADGNTSLSLRYVDHSVQKVDDNISLYTFNLKDPAYPFFVKLFYKVYEKQDLIEQWTEIRHKEGGAVKLKKFASANLYLKADDYWLRHFHGDWAQEMQPELTKLQHGITTLDTKLGTRANLFQPSVFMVGLNGKPREDGGDVLFGGMEWSGNFRIDLEVDYQDNLRLIAGMNNYESTYTLEANQPFETPKFWYVLSHNGKGAASRKVHDWARDYKILDGKGDRLTLLNNWEATYFDFNEQKLFNLIEDAGELGVDLFLLDDGWFGNKHPRNDDHAGLGDWEVNKKKLPNGISSLIKHAQENGVKFGIWVEPEMVNPKSELYHEHPDWVIKQPERPEHYFRNQLVLDLSNPEVQDFVFNVVDDLFTENPGLAYVKWDANSVIYNAHSEYLEHQSHLYIEYVRGLYSVLQRFRAKHPDVPMMLCSGGGGRVDYGALQYFTEFWPSDNTDPLERVYMQWEYSNFYPAIATASHVTEWGDASPKYRVDVAMMGKLGFDVVVDELEPEVMKFYQQSVETYNHIKSTVWHGDLYRLASPYKNSVASLIYVDPDQSSAVMFNYRVKDRFRARSQRPIRLKGLDPDKKYTVKEINLFPGTKSTIDASKVYSGEFLMQIGINPNVNARRKSVVLEISEE